MEENAQTDSDESTFRRLARLAARERAALIASTAAGAVQSAAWLVLPASIGAVMATLSAGPAATLPALAIAGAAWATALAAGALSRERLAAAEARLAGRVREERLTAIAQQPLRWLESKPNGDLLARLTADVEGLSSLACALAAAVPPLALLLVGALFGLGGIDPWLAACAVALVPVALATGTVLRRGVRARRSAMATAHGHLLETLREPLENALSVRAFGQGERELRASRSASEHHRAARLALVRAEVGIAPLFQGMGAIAVLLVAGVALARGLTPTPSALAAVLGHAWLLSRALGSLAPFPLRMGEASAMLERLDALGPMAAAAVRNGTIAGAGRSRPALQTRRLTHAPRGRAAVLDGIDLELRRGEIVALLGPNGAGKSTLLQLLAGLLEPDDGDVWTCGWAPHRMSEDDRVSAVALAPQRVELFDRSVAENIAYGRRDASADEITLAARRAGAHELIARLPSGAGTRLGPRGTRLSGGERQRIGLARALLLEPEVLLLDEALSMVEAGGERRFLERSGAWLRERATLLVTHRHESLRLCDRVLRLEDGRIFDASVSDARRASNVVRLVRPSASPPPR